MLSKFDFTYNTVGTIATKEEQADSSTPTLWTYGYDGADQLLSATRTNTSTSAVISQYFYGYDLAGNRSTEQVGLGVMQSSFNNLNQTTGSSAGGPLRFAGTLSKPGTVTVGGSAATMDSTFENFSGTTSVTTGTNNVPVVATSANGYASTNTYQVVVPTGTSVTPTYDGDGNELTSGTGETYTWDAENEMVSIVYSSGPNSGNHTEFAYDAMGRRIAIVERNGTTLGSGTVTSTKQFVWIGSNIAEERDASNSVTKRFYPQGEQIGSTNYYYTRDHLGSVREMVDSSGTIQARYDYDPYGRATKVSGSLDSDFQYAGYYTHATSGLNLTLFRAYDPNTARWLSRDPMGEGSDATLYSYVWNRPINMVDPLGLFGFFFFSSGTASVPTPAGVMPATEGIYLWGWDSSKGFYSEQIIAGGVEVGTHNDNVCYFKGSTNQSGNNGKKGSINLLEGNFGPEAGLGGANVGSGAFTTDSGDAGNYAHVGGDFLGEGAAVGGGISW